MKPTSRSAPTPERSDPRRAAPRAAHHARLAQTTDLPVDAGRGRAHNAKARTHKTSRRTGA
jgi:hypothetical protein